MVQARFFDRLEELEGIMAQAPSEVGINRFLELTKDSALNEYAYAHLNDPRWLIPLYTRGVFNIPPPPIKQDKNIIFQQWPASYYLARMAIHLPNIVHDIALEIPCSDNILDSTEKTRQL